MITVEENKIVFSKDDCPFLPGTILTIQYEQKDGEVFPVIGNVTKFGLEKGYKLTKSYSFNIKGQNYAYIASFGTKFVLEQKDSDLYKMIPTKSGIIVELEEIDYNQEILEDTNYNIDLIKNIL